MKLNNMKQIIKSLLKLPREHQNVLEQLSLRVVSSTIPGLPSGPVDLQDLLSANCSDFGGHRTLFQVDSQQAYHIWIRQVLDTSPWTFEDGVAHAEHFMNDKSARSTTFLFTIDSRSDGEKAKSKTHIASIISLQSEEAQSILTPYQDRQTLEENLMPRTSRSRKCINFTIRNLPFVIVGIVLVLMIVALTATPMLRYKGTTAVETWTDADDWIKWDIPEDSIGPRHQLQYTYPHPDFITWTHETQHQNDHWLLRLDDQSMIPAHLADPDELRYQAWYRARYPVFEQLRTSKDFLNESYYAEPRAFALEIDDEYHTTHCVLALKRYWRAKESGHHICPRDLDRKHLAHCFDVLESYLIPGFDLAGHEDERANGRSIAWLVNACF